MFGLQGRVAVVTGGSRGIGRACSIALAERGAHVVVCFAAREDAAAEVVESIRGKGGSAEARRVDVASADQVEETFSAITKERGKLDILVSNAGVAADNLLLRVRQDDLDKVLGPNVAGAIWTAKSAVRSMMRARWGRIVFMSSVVGQMGNPGQAVYAASKSALFGLTKTLAKEYGSRGITVNAVAPGLIETEMTASMPQQAKDHLIAATPLGRYGRVEDVASAVVYLVSEEAGFVTGQVLAVNGGLYT